MTHLSCAGRVVADYVVRPDLALALSPRPYLHPVRTLAGVRVSEAVPQDHPWHLGVSVALQHVQEEGEPAANFWGGRTYRRGQGYRWLDDHGRVEHLRWIARDPSSARQELSWRVPGRSAVLREYRSLRASPVVLPVGSVDPAGSAGELAAWSLRIDFALENVTQAEVRLGSPGTEGRARAGYGGFFWRAAASDGDLRVFTPQGRGEDEVHGKSSEWLVFGGSELITGRPWSLLLAGEDAPTRADPWFVRTRDYPGVGSALAFERPIRLVPGEQVSRSLRVVVVDGIIRNDTAFAVLAAARGR